MTSRRWLPDGSRLPAGGKMRAALFLDRDGVLVDDVHFLTRVEQIQVIESAATALRRLQHAFVLIVATNQSGIARGLLDESALAVIHHEIAARFAARGVQLDGVYYCPHHPAGSMMTYRRRCECRKPRPGLLRQAASDWDLDLERSFMIGDRQTDLEAGSAAGAQPFRIHPTSHSDDWAQLTASISHDRRI